MRRTIYLAFAAIGLLAYLAGYWSHPMTTAKADSVESPIIAVEPIRGDTGLTVYYPGLKRFFVYSTPFVGLPTWNCAYSIQLSTPGGPIERQPCPATGQVF